MAVIKPRARRIGLVLSGGGARGAYEAGVLSHLFEEVLPALPPGTEFQVVSGTSVGAIHAAYVAASAGLPSAERAGRLAATWREMRVANVVRLSVADLVGVPLRALGVTRLERRAPGPSGPEVVGGLVDVAPLERIVHERIPWSELPAQLQAGGGRALCVSCTEVRTGRGMVFLDGPLADPGPWSYDPHARAIVSQIHADHVRASAAIPFLFPAVRIGESFFVDGGLRMNTPLSPALRLGCDRVLVVALKHRPTPESPAPEFPVEVITQPTFLLGKVLDAVMLDQLDVELRRLELVNAILAHGTEVFGADFLAKMNLAVREKRGVGYRHVEAVVVRPSEDIGRLAAHCYRKSARDAKLGLLPGLLARVAMRGAPDQEADLLSYLFFDRSFTGPLVALGREDARRRHDELVTLLS
jgi:NTE family protein